MIENLEHYKSKSFWNWINSIFWINDQRGVVFIPPAIWIICLVASFAMLAQYNSKNQVFHVIVAKKTTGILQIDPNCTVKYAKH